MRAKCHRSNVESRGASVLLRMVKLSTPLIPKPTGDSQSTVALSSTGTVIVPQHDRPRARIGGPLHAGWSNPGKAYLNMGKTWGEKGKPVRRPISSSGSPSLSSVGVALYLEALDVWAWCETARKQNASAGLD